MIYATAIAVLCCFIMAAECGAKTADLRYPRPDFQRDAWVSLDGKWGFAFDDKDAGVKERWFAGHKLDRTISVPYPYQAKLSGIGKTEHHKVVWYSRKFTVPAEFAGKRVRLHIGALDYAATLWVNGEEAGKDEGGYVPFQFDITPHLRDGENELTIRVFDDPLDGAQPRGKQHPSGGTNRCHYTHITGIWQPVWLEAVPNASIGGFRVTPRLEPRGADIVVTTPEGEVRVTVHKDGKKVTATSAMVKSGKASISLSMPEAELWSPEHPELYGLDIELTDGAQVLDKVRSYFGIRTVSMDGNRILLNGKPIWLNMALVQGYWPDGLYVPPSPEDYAKDIEFCKQVGLNGIRMHQKVEDPRFLYLCDKMGLLVWGEMANAGEGRYSERACEIADRLWERTIERDFNHPCIMTWVYSNESWMHGSRSAEEVAHYAKAYALLRKLDPTRLVIDTSGWWHVKTDIWDTHGVRGVADAVAWTKGGPFTEAMGPTFHGVDYTYQDQPLVLSEWVAMDDFDKADEAFYNAYSREVIALAESGVFCGQCYIQLNDVENELNGYTDYDRAWKVDAKRIADIHAKASSIYHAKTASEK